MDCYPSSFYHYNNIHNTYFSSNNNPSMNHRFGSLQPSNENQQSPFYEGFARHGHLHSHHHNSANHFGSQGSYSAAFETNNESSQFYYANLHQQPTASSYYANHPHHHPHFSHQNTYDSYPYRNIPANYRNYPYGYHQSQHLYPPNLQSHSPHHFYQLPQQQGYNSNSDSIIPYNHHYSTPSTTPSQHQQREFNSSPNSTRSNDYPSSSSSSASGFNAPLEGRQKRENLVDKDAKHTEDDSTIICPTNVADDDKTNNDNAPTDDQQVHANPSSQGSMTVEKSDENSNGSKDLHSDEQNKTINKNDDNNNKDEEVAKKHQNESFNENESCKENQQNTQQKEETTSATDYSPKTSKVNKIPQHESEKQQNIATVSRCNEQNTLPHLNDRSSTPIHYSSHNSNLQSAHNYTHKRYPLSWYSQHEYYNNWMMSPDDRRTFPDSHTFFSSMRSKNNKNPDKHKMHHDQTHSATKRTKRKPKLEEPIQKIDPIKEKMKNVTPLPGFLQTFGQTEIGKFSEAFYTSDSPIHYYNNIESDIDSPQLDWDSLDGPVGNPMPTQVASSFYMYGSENDSPKSSFSEIMCKDF